MATRERAEAAHRDVPQQSDASAAVMAPPLPPLENGDRLTRTEFERRYEAMSRLKKAELIDGVVYVQSQVPYEHGRRSSDVAAWLGVYSVATPGTRGASNTTVRLDLDTEVQPDVLLRLEQGGRSRIDAEDYVEGAPELVVEVAASSASYDLHDKLRVYRRSGVQEYLVWRVLDQAVDWLALHEGTYRPLGADAEGIVRSSAFPGLWLAVPTLLAGDLAAVLTTLQVGLASPEHAAFLARLRATPAPQAPSPQA
jgi:Uma2 family endonuclease